MSAWVKIPASVQLTNEFNGLNPDRDKGADGDIGDASHTSSSDHTPDEDSDKLRNKDADTINEVHAKDIDSTGPWPGTTFDAIIQYIIGECRKPNDVGKDYGRFRYIIWDHHIYEAPNWEKVPYTATPDPHTNHAHFSFEYITEMENDTRPYGILEKFGDDLPMDQATFTKMLAQALTDIKIQDLTKPADPNRNLAWRTWIGYSDGRADVGNLTQLTKDIGGQVSKLTNEVAALNDKIDAHISGLLEGEKSA